MSMGSKFPIVLTVAGGLAVATTGNAFAAPVPSNNVVIKASAPATATQVRYRSHVERPYQGYGSYPYWGHSYWGPQYSYPAYAYPRLVLGLPGLFVLGLSFVRLRVLRVVT